MPWITSLLCSSDVSVSERPASVTAHRLSSRSSCCSRSRPIVFSRLLIAVSFCLIVLLFCLIAVSFYLSSLCSLRIVCSEDSITCCGDQNGSKSFGKIFMIQLCIKSSITQLGSVSFLYALLRSVTPVFGRNFDPLATCLFFCLYM